MVGLFCTDFGQIQPVWKNFGHLGRYSTIIGGGNSTARIRPFLNEFRQKKLLCRGEWGCMKRKIVWVAPLKTLNSETLMLFKNFFT
jgi:hypothetical protein